MNTRKLLIILSAVIMLLSMMLAGCTSGSKDSGSTPRGETDEQAVEASQKEVEVSFPLVEKLNLKMVGVPHGNVKKDYNEMSLFQQLEKDTNVHVDWNLITSDGAREKINLMFATNDLPDAFFGPETTSSVTADKTQQLIPLNNLIDKYAPNFSKILEENEGLRDRITNQDGNIYSLPMMEDNVAETIPSAMFINKKWLDELGLALQTTTDEFYNVLQAFKDGDPNKNGKSDEIPFSFLVSHGIQGPDSLALSFGGRLPSGHMYLEDGKVVYAPIQDNNKDYYMWLNKLYREKLIDQEIFTHNADVYKAKVSGETVGAFFAWTENWAFTKDNPDYVPLLPLKGPNGQQGWNNQINQVNREAFSITVANEHPEATLAWADQFYSEEISIGATNGTVGVVLKKEGDKYAYNPIPEGMDSIAFRFDNAPGYYAPRWISQERFRKVEFNTNLQEKVNLVDMYKPYTKDVSFTYPTLSLEDEERVKQWGTDVSAKNAFYEKSLAKIVMGDTPEKALEDMVAGLKKLGADEITAIYQKYLDQ